MKSHHLFLGSLLAVGVSFSLLYPQPVQAVTTITICNKSGQNLDVAVQQKGINKQFGDGITHSGIVQGWYFVMAGECQNIELKGSSFLRYVRSYSIYAQGTTQEYPSQSPPPTYSFQSSGGNHVNGGLCVNMGVNFVYGQDQALKEAAFVGGKGCRSGFRLVRFSRDFSTNSNKTLFINPSDLSPKTSAQSSSSTSTPESKFCVSVDSKRGWQRFNLPGSFTKITSITGGWTIDKRSYAPIGASGYRGEDAQSLSPYNQYKYNQSFPFAALLMSSSQGALWITGPSLFSSAPFSTIDMRINDGDNALGDNEGALQVCFGK